MKGQGLNDLPRCELERRSSHHKGIFFEVPYRRIAISLILMARIGVFDMIVGYARTSTVEQVAGFEAQVRELQSIGAKKILREQISSVASRAQLDAAIDFCREGDTLVVCKLDRLARSVRDLVRIIDTLKTKDVALRILNMNFDTASPTGK